MKNQDIKKIKLIKYEFSLMTKI